MIVEKANADATVFALFAYSDVLHGFFDFENSPFYIVEVVKVTFFYKSGVSSKHSNVKLPSN